MSQGGCQNRDKNVFGIRLIVYKPIMWFSVKSEYVQVKFKLCAG